MSNIGQEDFRVVLDDGKYEIAVLHGGGARWLRHGEPWDAAQANFAHSKVIYSMLYRIHELEGALRAATRGDAPAIGQRAAHYGAGVQPWDHIRASGWGPEFAAGNALKYVRRYRQKNGADDLQKGRWYYYELVQMVAESEEANSREINTPYDHAGRVFAQLEMLLTTEERAILRARP